MGRTESVDLLIEQTDRITEKVDQLTDRAERSIRQSDGLVRKSQWSNWTVLAMLVLCFFVIVLLAVACGRGAIEDVSALRRETEAVLRQQNLALPIYADPGAVSRSAVGLHGLPTTLVLDRRGRIRGVWEGFDRDANRLKPGLQQIVAGGYFT